MARAHPNPGGRRVTRLAWPDTRTIWRWHFYAGLFCIPFVLLLSTTGLVYLFKPQIDDLIDWRYEHLAAPAHPAAPAAEARAALRAVPGSSLLAYELPRTDRSAARVIVLRGGEALRVYVDPGDLTIRKTVPEEWRFERIIFNLHGQLLLGNRGSLVVELVASWAIVMILTGLCLWWPRPSPGRSGAAGLLYPRLRAGGRIVWRDLHAVSGFWASMLVLFLLVSGLPWSYGWGSYLQAMRSAAGATAILPDWRIGHVPARTEIAGPAAQEHMARTMPDMAGMAAPAAIFAAFTWTHPGALRGWAIPSATDIAFALGVLSDMGGMAMPAPAKTALPSGALDRVVAAVQPLHLAYPVLVTPPKAGSSVWAARSDAQDRLLRTTLAVSADGRILRRTDFGERKLLDRIVGIGVAVHEGRLFGWPNVVLNAFAALSMIMVSISGLTMWLTRRRPGRLGAPVALASRPVARVIIVLAALLAVALPMFGLSVALVALAERLVLRRIPRVADWLGLDCRERARA